MVKVRLLEVSLYAKGPRKGDMCPDVAFHEEMPKIPLKVHVEQQVHCCTVGFGGNTLLRFCGNSFFEKFRGNSCFSSKGRSLQKGGRGPPFLGKRGLLPIFWGTPAKILTEIPTEFSFGIGVVNTEKYRPIPTKKYRLVNSHILPKLYFPNYFTSFI